MGDSRPGPEGTVPGGFTYFMIRLHHGAEQAGIRGLVERLGTGDKRAFGSAEELTGLLERWRPGIGSGPDDATHGEEEP